MSDIKKIKFELILCIVAAVVVFIIWLLPTILNVHGVNHFEAVHQAISGLFAGLAFIGLVYTIILQREILDTQKKELQATRDIMNAQKLEATFINIISNHEKFVSNMNIDRNADCKGFHVIKKISDSFMIDSTLSIDEKISLFEKTFASHFGVLGNYFTRIELYLDFLETSEDTHHKTILFKYMQSHLNPSELVIVSAYCLTKKGSTLLAKMQKVGWLSRDEIEKFFSF